MKSDLSLGDLKKQKKVEKFFKKRALKQISIFFIIWKLPIRPELDFFIAFSLSGTQNWFIFGKKFKFEVLFW